MSGSATIGFHFLAVEDLTISFNRIAALQKSGKTRNLYLQRPYSEPIDHRLADGRLSFDLPLKRSHLDRSGYDN